MSFTLAADGTPYPLTADTAWTGHTIQVFSQPAAMYYEVVIVAWNLVDNQTITVRQRDR